LTIDNTTARTSATEQVQIDL